MRRSLYRFLKNLTVFALVFFAVSLSGCKAGGNSGNSGGGNTLIPGNSILSAPKKDITEMETVDASGKLKLTGVLSYVDTTEKRLRFIDINSGVEYEMPYSGGTDIRTKYDSVIAVVNMKLGEIYDIVCSNTGMALSIYGNKNMWESSELTGVVVDENKKKINSGANEYSYFSNTLIISEDDKIKIAEIVEQDEVTLRGIDNTVYSVSVDKGHGYIKFTGINAFLGGYATIGAKYLVGVTDNMLVTMKEGTYKVELQNGSIIGTKEITVQKNVEQQLDFSEYVLPAKQMGTVSFSVTPKNAVMSIDGVEVDYSTPIALTYGTHKVKLVCNHYAEYTETFTVNSAYITKVIDMEPTSNTASTSAVNTSGYKVEVTAPVGAALYVDSAYVGIVPCSFEKSYGNKTVTLSKSGYNTISYTIAIANASGDLTYAFPDLEAN
ncbi:MAG: PEGA domain-containing protein [Lachnospiraceae bacterium]